MILLALIKELFVYPLSDFPILPLPSDRQTDRQTGRQTETHRDTEGQTERQTDKQRVEKSERG